MTRRTRTRNLFISTSVLGAGLAVAPLIAPADVIRDGTIGPDNATQATGPNFQIPQSHGELRGANLYHSFRQFNLSQEQSATFTATAPVTNIIGRITGIAQSSINGKVTSAVPGANLYLINPRGIVFGTQAQIDVDGAFHASTADTLRFDNGDEFPTSREAPPLLSVAAPTDFGFLESNTGDIRINSGKLSNAGDISLSARDVKLENFAGIENAAPAADPQQPPSNDPPPAITGEIRITAKRQILLNKATLNSPNGITLAGRAIRVQNGTKVSTERSQDGAAGHILITADEHITFDEGNEAVGDNDKQPPPGKIETESFFGRPGGDITLKAPRIEFLDAGGIKTVGKGNGKGGDIRLEATEHVRITGTSGSELKEADGTVIDDKISTPLGTRTDPDSRARGGSIHVHAPVIMIEDGARILTDTDGSGAAGDVNLTASEAIRLRGVNQTGDGVRIDSDTEKLVVTGAAGDVKLEAPIIEMRDGASISVHTDGAGGGGSITLKGGERVLLSGRDQAGGRTRLEAASFSQATGAAGNIWVEAPRVRLENGATITTQKAGNVQGTSPEGAGDITVDAGLELNLAGSAINAASLSKENAGTVNIHSQGTITLHDSAITTAAKQASGGNINIKDARLFYAKDSDVTTDVGTGTGQGGNINLGAQTTFLHDSKITAKADRGQGGNIEIDTNNFFSTPASEIDASAGGVGGVDGQVDIRAPETELEGSLAALPDNFLDATKLMRPSCTTPGDPSQRSRLHVEPRRGLPASPEGMLLVLDNAATPRPPASTKTGLRTRGGHYRRARQHWLAVSQDPRLAKDQPAALSDALHALAQTEHALGYYADSVDHLRSALEQARASGDPRRIAAALSGLGNAHLALGQPASAQTLLQHALGFARRGDDASVAAGVLNSIGNVRLASRSPQQALQAYQASVRVAHRAGHGLATATALSNAARTQIKLGQIERALVSLRQVEGLARTLPASPAKVHLLIHLAKSYEQLAEEAPEQRKTALLAAVAGLHSATQLSESLDEPRALSFALGNLGTLYFDERRYDEALYLTRRAVRAADRALAPEALYRWHWQAGRILWAQGRADDALQAYRRAVDILAETRHETLDRYDSSELYFQRAVAPVYLELADALLQRAAAQRQRPTQQQYLREARATVERFKAAELRDYFRDQCVAQLRAKDTNLEAVAPRTAIVYPILLPDRLEFIVSLAGGLRRYTVEVNQTELTQLARRFRFQLESLAPHDEHVRISQQLYRYLVQPYAADLQRARVQTLVFVPDGLLRNLPLAALHDGRDFLVKRYQIAVTLGLSLTDPRPLDTDNAKLLLAGLSEAVQGFPSLPSVPKELQTIRKLYGGDLLLNREFTLENIADAMRQPASIVHIASHAQFSGKHDQSFLLAFDGKLSIDQLHQYLSTGKYSQRPLELLFLSACQTAAGDHRAALGLAGIGIKAGARSAIGSLWSISDDAAAALVTEFYGGLKSEQKRSKAAALQQAQLRLLDNPRYAHPFYWSPFLLVDNWL